MKKHHLLRFFFSSKSEWVKCELSVQGNGIVAIYDEDDFSAEYHFLDGKMYDMEENVVDDQTVKVPKDKDLEICFVPDDRGRISHSGLPKNKTQKKIVVQNFYFFGVLSYYKCKQKRVANLLIIP